MNGPIPHPTGPKDVVLRVAFVPAASAGEVPPEPPFTLYGDGTVIVQVPPAAEPQPSATPSAAPSPSGSPGRNGQGNAALPDLRVIRLSEAGVQAVLRRAAQAGLFGPSATLGGPSNAATEIFTVSLSGVHREIEVQGGVDLVPPGGADQAVRARLGALQRSLFDLGSWLPAGAVLGTEAYAPTGLAVYVDERAAGTSPADVPWPLKTRLATFGSPSPVNGFRCAVVTGQDLARLEAAARGVQTDQRWRDGSNAYSLVLRPLLPDRSGC